MDNRMSRPTAGTAAQTLEGTDGVHPPVHPPGRPAAGWTRWLFVALLVWMVFSFAIGGLSKFYWEETIFGPAYEVKFVEWGYPQWFRFIVGGGELVGVVLLLFRRWRFHGAVLLMAITAGAVVTHIIDRSPIGEGISAPTHMVLSAVIVWVCWPADRNELLTGRLQVRR